MRAKARLKGLAKLLPEWAWNYTKRKPIASYNPARAHVARAEIVNPVYTIFDYNSTTLTENNISFVEACQCSANVNTITWINVDGLKKAEVEELCACYNIHPLVIEDILSIGQRAKMDETGDVIFCLLPMLYYNEGTGQIETEQVSIVLGKGCHLLPGRPEARCI